MQTKYKWIGFVVLFVLSFFAQQLVTTMFEKETERVFVYATLKNTIARWYACRCIVHSEPYTIRGYHVHKLNLYPSDDSAVVHGFILHGTPTELSRFDRYEHVPEKYQRTHLDALPDGTWVYLKK